MKPDFQKHLSPRARKWLLRGAVAFVVYSLAGFFLLPAIVKWQLVKQLPGITKRHAAVQQVKMNPWTLSLTIRGLALTEPDGRPFASWDEFYVNFQSSSIFRWAWTFKEIRLVQPAGEIILLKNGQLNVANMFEAPTNAPPVNTATSIPRVNIFELAITNGFVTVEDRTRRSVFHTEYRPINLHLKNFTTRPDTDTPYSFRAESDSGRSITWAGDLSVQPLHSAGRLEITGIKLSRYQPYLEDFTSAIVTNGLADCQVTYRFAAGTNGLDLTVTNGAVQVAEVQVLDPSTSETVASLKGLEVREADFDFRSKTAHVGEVKVTEAALLARLLKNGHVNLLDLITLPAPATNAPVAATASASAAAGAMVVTVDNFAIERTAVSFEDLSRRTPFKTELKPIEVQVKNFSTKPDSDAGYTFRLATEVAESLEGGGTFSISPIRSAGTVKLGDLDLKKYLPYVEEFFRGQIVSGKVAVQAPYRAAIASGKLLAGVTNLSVTLTDLALRLPESSETITRVREFAVAGVDASLEDQRGRVGLIRGDGASVMVRRDKAGAINLLGLLALSPTNPPPAAAPAAGDDAKSSAVAIGNWTVNLDQIQITNYQVKVEDSFPGKTATVALDQVALSLKGLSTASNTPISFDGSFRLNETGFISASGTAKIAPLAADVRVAVTNLDLRVAQPYVEQFVSLGISSGALTTTGEISFQTNNPSAPMLKFAGDVAVRNFVTTDGVVFKEFVRWDELAVSGIQAALLPNSFQIAELRMVKPKATLLIGADRRPNLSMILRQDATNAPTATNAPPAAAPASSAPSLAEQFPLRLDSLVLDRASFAFADDSVRPRVGLGVEEVSGSIKGLSSALNTPASVDLHGRVDAQSPFSITGSVNPFAATRFVDLTITNADTQLTPLTGYMEKYGGYLLKKGRISTSLHYRVEGMELKAENKIQVDQLTLGPRNNSPDAPSLPLKLGVALLKDADGRIALDVPISGRLDDPKFSLAPIVLKVVVNMVVKAATSPFKLLGALVGGGGDELSFVEFTPGQAQLLDGETNKLTKLASALTKRPTLTLEIEGAVDTQSDRQALASHTLEEQLKVKRLRELTAKGREPESTATFQVESEERERLLRAAFVEQFGTNIAQVIQTNLARLTATNQVAASTPPPKRKHGLIMRFVGLFGIGPASTPKAERRLSKADRQALGMATPDLMATLLAEKIEVTEEEYRQLMSARARFVQDWLVQNGQVTTDRLFILAPKPVDASYAGQSRVNLSLD